MLMITNANDWNQLSLQICYKNKSNYLKILDFLKFLSLKKYLFYVVIIVITVLPTKCLYK